MEKIFALIKFIFFIIPITFWTGISFILFEDKECMVCDLLTDDFKSKRDAINSIEAAFEDKDMEI